MDKKILDPRDKKEILCANVLVSKDNKNKITYDVDMTCNEIQPITPRVGSGMIPIVYKDGNWVKADRSNKNFAWFNYGNQQWANVATVTEDVRQTLLDAPDGTVVPMDKINTMFTWIPRFKYKLFNVDGTVSPVGNKNLAGDYMIDIQFETASTVKSMGTQNGQWLTHPAFTFGGQELEGFWMAKFETGYKDATTTAEAQVNALDPTKIIVKPSTYSWRGVQVVNMYKNAQGMKDPANPYGFTANEDPHLTKNMEWGAMAYLTQSKYGKQGNSNYCGGEKQVRINNNNMYLTGCGADSQNAANVATCNSYETSNGIDLEVSSSGFEQAELKQIGRGGKYLDVYEFSTTWQNLSRGHLGDATLEIGPVSSYKGAWYGKDALFVGGSTSWFVRSGHWDDSKGSGLLTFSCTSGNLSSKFGSRVVVV